MTETTAAPTIEERIKNILADQAGADVEESTLSLRDDLQLDSLDMVEVGMALEDDFDLTSELTDGDLSKLITVQDVIDIIAQRTKPLTVQDHDALAGQNTAA